MTLQNLVRRIGSEHIERRLKVEAEARIDNKPIVTVVVQPLALRPVAAHAIGHAGGAAVARANSRLAVTVRQHPPAVVQAVDLADAGGYVSAAAPTGRADRVTYVKH